MLRTSLAAALLLIPSIAAAECGPSLQAAGQRAAQGGGPGSLIDLASMAYERAEAAGTPQACEGGVRALDRLTALGGHAAPEGRRAEAFDAVMNEAAAAVAVVGETTSPALEAPLVQIIDAATEMGLVILVSQGSAPTAAQRLEAAQKSFAEAAGKLRVAEAEVARSSEPLLAPVGQLYGYDKALKELIAASKARRDFTTSVDRFATPGPKTDDPIPSKPPVDEYWMSLPEAYRREWADLERQEQIAINQLNQVCDSRYDDWTHRYVADPTAGHDLDREVIKPCQEQNKAIVERFIEKFRQLDIKYKIQTDEDGRDPAIDTSPRWRSLLQSGPKRP